MIKDLNNIGGNNIVISSTNNVIKFSCNSNGVYSRDIMFGESEEDDEEKENVTQDFETEQLTRISKVAGLSSQIQIYQSQDLPILFKSNIGNLGKIFVYLKDRTLHEDILNDNDDE